MLRAVQEQDKYNNTQTHYYLTQGDSCIIYLTPYKDGQLFPIEDITACIFKLSDTDYNEEFQKALEVDTDTENNRFILTLTSEETANLEVATHYYEFELTLTGGYVQTVHQWKWDIINQII